MTVRSSTSTSVVPSNFVANTTDLPVESHPAVKLFIQSGLSLLGFLGMIILFA